MNAKTMRARIELHQLVADWSVGHGLTLVEATECLEKELQTHRDAAATIANFKGQG